MNVLADLGAVQRRIDDIGGVERPAPSPRAQAERFTAGVANEMQRLVTQSARAAGVDPALVRAVARTESGFDPRATSATGAAGLMQLMPATARALGVPNPYDPLQNARGGAHYLHDLLERFSGDVGAALAAYNAGPAAVVRYGGIPPYPETQAYVARVLAAYRADRER